MVGLPVVKSFSDAVALFPSTIEGVKAAGEATRKNATEGLQGVFNTQASERTFEHIKRAWELWAMVNQSAETLWAVSQTNTDKAVREAAEGVNVDLQKFAVDTFSTNKDLYKLLDEYLKSAGELEEDRKYILDEELEAFKRRGLGLDGDAFQRAVDLQKELSELDTEFQSNISEDNRTITVAAEDLKGVGADVLESFGKGEKDGEYVLKPDYPTNTAVMKNCEVAETRKRFFHLFSQRAYPKNEKVLRTVIERRHELATLLRYDCFANLDIAAGMAKNVQNVEKFLEGLVPGFKQKFAGELELLKKELPPSVQLDEQGRMHPYDVLYLVNEYTKKHLEVDDEKVKEYFPLDATVKGLFEIYQTFFNLEFTDIEGAAKELWHESCSAMAVRRKPEEGQEEGCLLGYVILDLFPRDGKYTHACCAGLVTPHEVDGKYQPAVAIVLANFNKASGDRPALLRHDDVVTFFHEFGHALHALHGRCEIATYAGYNTKRDFVELPSQLLEEWMWEPALLRQVSKHYETGEPLPDDLIDRMVKARFFFAGRHYLRQAALTALAMEFFSAENGKNGNTLDLGAVRTGIDAKFVPHLAPDPEDHFECAFGHLLGYGASYYSYLWAEVFACDVFRTIKASNGLLDPVWGKKYADSILLCGGGKEHNKMLVDFLGRAPRVESFMEHIGLVAH